MPIPFPSAAPYRRRRLCAGPGLLHGRPDARARRRPAGTFPRAAHPVGGLPREAGARRDALRDRPGAARLRRPRQGSGRDSPGPDTGLGPRQAPRLAPAELRRPRWPGHRRAGRRPQGLRRPRRALRPRRLRPPRRRPQRARLLRRLPAGLRRGPGRRRRAAGRPARRGAALRARLRPGPPAHRDRQRLPRHGRAAPGAGRPQAQLLRLLLRDPARRRVRRAVPREHRPDGPRRRRHPRRTAGGAGARHGARPAAGPGPLPVLVQPAGRAASTGATRAPPRRRSTRWWRGSTRSRSSARTART